MTKIKKTADSQKAEEEEEKTSENQTVDQKNKELEEQLKRALADYQNLERRVEEERRLLNQLSLSILIEKFLPVLDNLESAQLHLNDQGLAMVIKQFQDILETEGVSQIKAEGEKFDPNFHEASEVTEGENDGTIAKIVRKGYKINDKVLRPALVIVEKKQDESHPEGGSPKNQILDPVENDNE